MYYSWDLKHNKLMDWLIVDQYATGFQDPYSASAPRAALRRSQRLHRAENLPCTKVRGGAGAGARARSAVRGAGAAEAGAAGAGAGAETVGAGEGDIQVVFFYEFKLQF